MADFKAVKQVATLPSPLVADTVYMVRAGDGFDLYVTDTTGAIAHRLNADTIARSVHKHERMKGDFLKPEGWETGTYFFGEDVTNTPAVLDIYNNRFNIAQVFISMSEPIPPETKGPSGLVLFSMLTGAVTLIVGEETSGGRVKFTSNSFINPLYKPETVTGKLEDLTTTNKTNLVAAINEANSPKELQRQLGNYNGLFYNGSFQTDELWTVPINFSLNDDAPFGARKSLKANTGNIGMRYITDLMPVTPNHVHRVAIEHKKINGTPRFYCGIAEFNVLGEPIIASNVMRIANTDTTLAQDLNDGDTVVHLTDVGAGWSVPHTQHYRNGFIFYTEVINGYKYKRSVTPYSKDFHFGQFDASGVNATAKTITLKQPWNKGFRVAGTEVSRCNAGGYYNYLLAAATYAGDEWTNIVKYIGGGISMDGFLDDTKFRPGTASVRMFLMFNALNGGESLYSNAWFERSEITRSMLGMHA